MTADATTRLREALAEALARRFHISGDGDALFIGDALADAILASLVEHRDDVLDVLGMEQVGWAMPNDASNPPEFLHSFPVIVTDRRTAPVDVRDFTEPVYRMGGSHE